MYYGKLVKTTICIAIEVLGFTRQANNTHLAKLTNIEYVQNK